MPQIPIACSLTSDDAAVRGDEWRTFVANDVTEVARGATGARLQLREGADTLLTAVDLSRREKACCPFFEFSLDLLSDGIWLVVRAPEDAAPVLDALLEARPS